MRSLYFLVILLFVGARAKAPKVKEDKVWPEVESNDIANSTSGTVKSGDIADKKAAAELQAKIEAIHRNDPRDALQLAHDVLQKVFARYQFKSEEVSISQLLEKLNETPGKTTLYFFRIFAYMDANVDYKINKMEFADFFMGPAANPGDLVELLLRVQDLNNDGVLNAYEYLWNEVISLGINYNLFDMWRSANQRLSEVDLNEDGVVDGTEWSHYVVFQINKAIVQQRVGS